MPGCDEAVEELITKIVFDGKRKKKRVFTDGLNKTLA